MNEQHSRYLADLRGRHAAERDELRAALAGRKSWLLDELRRRQRAVEDETRVILEASEARR
jgi:hypothetical protein